MSSTALFQLLIHRLSHKDVSVDHIPALVRNVLQIISDGGLFTTQGINEKLEQLGWGPEPLDETCFQLIVCILECEWGFRAKHYHGESSEQMRQQIGDGESRRLH
jgi:hypothetical protein